MSTARTRAKLSLFVVVIAASAVIGASYAAVLDIAIRSELSASSLLRGALRGIIIGVTIWSFEMFLRHGPWKKRLRQMPFLTSFSVGAIASTAVLMAAIIVSRALLGNRGLPMAQWFSIGFLRDTVFAFVAVSALHFVIQVRRIVGGRVLTNFILGRYHRPVNEERIFMFVDIVGSTQLAQRLGDVGAHALISRFFFDIAEPVLAFGGETHRYIGDEVVITWPMGDDVANARCIECYVAICDLISAAGPSYQTAFGCIPKFRVGLHGGPVVAGECGDEKREIVYFGDTVNTAKRIEQACRDFDRMMLISGDLLARMKLPPQHHLESLGTTRLRGRNHDLALFSLAVK